MLKIQHSELISLFFWNGRTIIGDAISITNLFLFLFFKTSDIETDYFIASSLSKAWNFNSSLKSSTLKKLESFSMARA